MDIHEKANMFTDDLLHLHFDIKDSYYYDTVNISESIDERRRNRTQFIDGQAWTSNLLASCLANPNDKNIAIAKNATSFLNNLDLVNGHTGRFARTYRTTDGDNWIKSDTMPGYYYKDGQAKAGPIAFTSAAAAALANKDLPENVRMPVLRLYYKFIRKFVNDGYKIMTATDQVAKHGDLSPTGIAGIINAHFVYAMLSIGAHAADIVGEPEDFMAFREKAKDLRKSLWSPTTIVYLYTKAMAIWDWTLRKFGSHRKKFSNDNLIYQLFSIWAYAPKIELLSDTKDNQIRSDIESACDIMYGMTKRWQNPFFDSVYSKLTGSGYNFRIDEITEVLNRYPAQRKRVKEFDLVKQKDIVPIEKRKPTSWLWRGNPYEEYIPKTDELSDAVRSPADFITAYNLLKIIM